MAYTFEIVPHALKRRFSVYVVIAQGKRETVLYVGKTGDNREGCNPLISRCGNHFSYNDVHSQIRNKIPAHESWKYTYVFDHFDKYCDDIAKRRTCIERVNEMERWLNRMIQETIRTCANVRLANRYEGRSWVRAEERSRRSSFRTRTAKRKLEGIVAAVLAILASGRIAMQIQAVQASRRTIRPGLHAIETTQ